MYNHKFLVVLICSLFLSSCGSGDSTNSFTRSISGAWSGDLQQSGLRCVSAVGGEPLYINSCSGCVLSTITFLISGGLFPEDTAVVSRGEKCELTGIRTEEDSFTAIPSNDMCNPFLLSTTFTLTSDGKMQFSDSSMTPEGPDENGEPICVMNSYGTITLAENND